MTAHQTQALLKKLQDKVSGRDQLMVASRAAAIFGVTEEHFRHSVAEGRYPPPEVCEPDPLWRLDALESCRVHQQGIHNQLLACHSGNVLPKASPHRIRQDLSSWLADRIQSAGHVPTHQMTVALGADRHTGQGPDFIRRWNKDRRMDVRKLASIVPQRVRRDVFGQRRFDKPPLFLSVPERLKRDRVTETPWHLHIVWFFDDDNYAQRWEERRALVRGSVDNACMKKNLKSEAQFSDADANYVRYATKNIYKDIEIFHSNIPEICTK
ncbi:hypothetical protein FKB34_11950 [Glycocaulis profundi]|nr:hypothetical protein FKB34_11950 [Glycocaulis profundi]